MNEQNCPLLNRPCVKEECAWYAAAINRCAVIAIGMMVERIHDMSTQAYQVYVEPVVQENQNR